ncbi:hypothetical protein DO97_14945 [Neosynechococcus sphagnicola sy1]|uniref:Uncharacterized protein n=1 Tax=Neosynechococcus sphagnicola sy1 TaxID=1497020 RepID=A0A098TIA3_9CYAN|nr:hypothetical protein DO97_14945 [Neosynechococcus sphagnicola sy1]
MLSPSLHRWGGTLGQFPTVVNGLLGLGNFFAGNYQSHQCLLSRLGMDVWILLVDQFQIGDRRRVIPQLQGSQTIG